MLIAALVLGGWSASCRDRFTPQERPPLGTNCIGVWLLPRVGVDAVKTEIKKLFMQNFLSLFSPAYKKLHT